MPADGVERLPSSRITTLASLAISASALAVSVLTFFKLTSLSADVRKVLHGDGGARGRQQGSGASPGADGLPPGPFPGSNNNNNNNNNSTATQDGSAHSPLSPEAVLPLGFNPSDHQQQQHHHQWPSTSNPYHYYPNPQFHHYHHHHQYHHQQQQHLDGMGGYALLRHEFHQQHHQQHHQQQRQQRAAPAGYDRVPWLPPAEYPTPLTVASEPPTQHSNRSTPPARQHPPHLGASTAAPGSHFAVEVQSPSPNSSSHGMAQRRTENPSPQAAAGHFDGRGDASPYDTMQSVFSAHSASSRQAPQRQQQHAQGGMANFTSASLCVQQHSAVGFDDDAGAPQQLQCEHTLGNTGGGDLLSIARDGLTRSHSTLSAAHPHARAGEMGLADAGSVRSNHAVNRFEESMSSWRGDAPFSSSLHGERHNSFSGAAAVAAPSPRGSTSLRGPSPAPTGAATAAVATAPTPQVDSVESFITKRRMLKDIKTDLLRHASIFKACDDATIADLVAFLKHETYASGEEIAREGTFGDCMFLLANGRVNSYGKDGQVLRKFGEGDFFGEFCLFRGGVRLTTYIATTTVDLFTLSREPLMDLLSRMPQLRETIDREIVVKVIECDYPLESRKDPAVYREMQRRIEEEWMKLKQRKDSSITFQLNRQIGSGATGVVYSAIDTSTGKPLAVKVVSMRGLTPAMICQIEQESYLCDTLVHENIVDGFGMTRDDEAGEIYVLMELMPMGSLHSLVKEYGPLTEATTRTYVRQILQGLTFLHMKGHLHRDLKPQNCLLSSSGTVKLADFGISRAGLEFQTTTIAGTPAYLSPEALEGRYGVASDIWACGMTLLELVTGAPPWAHLNAENPMTIIFHISNVAKNGYPLPPVVDPGAQRQQLLASQQAQEDGITTPELPRVDVGISPKLHDLLSVMLAVDPCARGDCDALLQHDWFMADREDLTTVSLAPTLRPDGLTYYGTTQFASGHVSVTENDAGSGSQK